MAIPTEGLVVLEAAAGGRPGVAALDTGSGTTLGHRAGERFPFCSTFKVLLAGAVVAAGLGDRRVGLRDRPVSVRPNASAGIRGSPCRFFTVAPPRPRDQGRRAQAPAPPSCPIPADRRRVSSASLHGPLTWAKRRGIRGVVSGAQAPRRPAQVQAQSHLLRILAAR